MVLRKLVIGVFCCLVVTQVYGQKYNIKTYTVNDGLPSSQIYDVYLDERGMVWMASTYGMVRYNGINFEIFGVSDGLRDELVYDIFEDSNGHFWVSTETGGVGIFYDDSLRYPEPVRQLDSLTILYINESPDKELWFATYEQGVMVWNPVDSTFSQIGTEEGLLSPTVWDVYFDSKGRSWISSQRGVSVYEKGKGLTRHINEENGLSGRMAYQAYEAKDGTMWIPTNDGITLLKPDGSLEKIRSLDGVPLNYVYTVVQDDEGLIWIGTESNGIFWFNPDNAEVTHITKKNGLSSNYIYRLIKGKDGTIWIATEGNGVSIFKDKRFRFYGADTPFGFKSVYSVHQSEDGILWFGAENAMVKFSNDQFQSYPLPKGEYFEEEIWDIEELDNGNLLLLTYDSDLIEFDGENYKKYEFREKLPVRYINDLYIDDGVIWLGTEEGLLKYADGSFELFDPDDEYWASYVNAIYRSSDGHFWLGTEAGIARFDGDQFVFFKKKDGLAGNSVFEIKEDAVGNIWIGSNRGVSVIKKNAESGLFHEIENFELEEEYLEETIFLQFDQYGGLWQGTNGGLNYFNTRKWLREGVMEKMHYPLQDYGKGVEMNGSVSILDDQNRLWFGTATQGVILYELDEDEISYESAPRTYIREVLAKGEVVYQQSIEQFYLSREEEIAVEYGKNSIEIHFTALNYKDPNRIFYKYRLKGFEDDWHQDFNINEVTYTNLPPGQYEFEIQAKSSKSDWNQQATLLKIKVDKPFWLSLGFFFFVGSILVGGIILYVNLRLNVLERKKLKELVEIQTKDLTEALKEREVLIKEVHHRVKNNLAVISGLLDLQIMKTKNNEVQKTLKNSQLRIRSMGIIHEELYQNERLSNIGFARYMTNLIEVIAQAMRDSTTSVTVNEQIDDNIQLTITQAVPCGLIMNELLSNAFEHAFQGRDEGRIDICIRELEDDLIQIKVKDDGIGMDPEILETERDSLGVTLITALTSQLHGELDYYNENGSSFTITFKKHPYNIGFLSEKEAQKVEGLT